MWVDRPIKSRHVIESDLTDSEKEIVRLVVNSAIKEKLNPNGRWLYFDGIQTGVAQTLRMLGRKDIWDLVEYEYSQHDELI